MPASTISVGDGLSPLAVDLALSRVSLAAVKILSDSAPDDDEIASAGVLKTHFAKYLTQSKPITSIPSSVVPEKTIRDALEETLSTLTEVNVNKPVYNTGILDKLLVSLDKLANRQHFGTQEALELLNSVLNLEMVAKEEEPLPTLEDIRTAFYER